MGFLSWEAEFTNSQPDGVLFRWYSFAGFRILSGEPISPPERGTESTPEKTTKSRPGARFFPLHSPRARGTAPPLNASSTPILERHLQQLDAIARHA